MHYINPLEIEEVFSHVQVFRPLIDSFFVDTDSLITHQRLSEEEAVLLNSEVTTLSPNEPRWWGPCEPKGQRSRHHTLIGRPRGGWARLGTRSKMPRNK